MKLFLRKKKKMLSCNKEKSSLFTPHYCEFLVKVTSQQKTGDPNSSVKPKLQTAVWYGWLNEVMLNWILKSKVILLWVDMLKELYFFPLSMSVHSEYT